MFGLCPGVGLAVSPCALDLRSGHGNLAFEGTLMTNERYPRTIDDLGGLTPAETRVLEQICRGDEAILADGLPQPDASDVTLRAGFIRYLALGGCPAHRPHAKGVMISGAFISGSLDLDMCAVQGRLGLVKCRMERGIRVVDASVGALVLTGSRLSHMTAHGVNVTGNVWLNDGFQAHGPVDLSGATIGGQLSCVRGTFSNEHGDAFAAQNARVSEIFLWRDVTVDKGSVRVTGMDVAALTDDDKSWPAGGRLMMDGFTYGRFVYGDTSAGVRLAWLEKHSSNEFQPQPYQQLAKVMGDMGHRYDRSRVLMTMERKMRAQQRKDMWKGGSRIWAPFRPSWNAARTGFHAFWDRVLRFLVGYGYRPWWALFWAIPIVVATTFLAQKVWDSGDFAPNAAPVLMSAAWQDLATDPNVENPAAFWACSPPADSSDCTTRAGRDFETFKAPLYALDLFVPLVNLGQDDAWAPSTSRGIWGKIAHNLIWLIKTIGWVMTAMVAGAVAGVIRND